MQSDSRLTTGDGSKIERSVCRRSVLTIAVGSAHEVAGTLDVMQRFDILAAAQRDAGHDLCDHLIAMLRRFR